jgi:myo-inositol-hexaphosphate 3-phosphohydrolase
MFIAQDGKNDECNQNFKFVPWQSIAATLGQAPSSASPAASGTSRSLAKAPQQHISMTATLKNAYLPLIIVSCK